MPIIYEPAHTTQPITLGTTITPETLPLDTTTTNGHQHHFHSDHNVRDYHPDFSHTKDSVHRVDTHVLEQGSATRQALCHAESNLVNNINKGNYDTTLAIDKNGSAGQIATQRVGDSVLVAIERSRAEITLSSQVIGAKQELLAAQNAASIAAALAACCCELKELARAEGSASRELARDIEARQVRDELQDAKLKAALATVTRVAPAHA